MASSQTPAEEAERGQAFAGQSMVVGVAHYDQPTFSPSVGGDSSTIQTQSHFPTETTGSMSKAGSLYSYNSTRDVSQYVKELYGRNFNTLNDAYPFPTDDVEWSRLDKQHSCYLIAFSGYLTPCPDVVDALLAPNGPEQKRVLDIGCGTGSWTLEMALRYPNAHIVGVDVAPTPDMNDYPPNLRFEIDDVNEGLEHFHGKYDLVHSRSISAGITDFRKLYLELQLCLKPGGLLIFLDGDKEFEDENHNKVKFAKVDGDGDVSGVSSEGSWFQRIMWEALDASIIAGSDHEAGIAYMDTGLWDEPLCDPATARAGSHWMPLGPWPRGTTPGEDEALKYGGLLMRQCFLQSYRAFRAILLKSGIPQETIDEWCRLADRELNTMVPRTWIRYRFCWARRRAEDGGPAPPLPDVESSTQPVHQYPALEFYDTKEEAVKARRRRIATAGVWPTSAVRRAMGLEAS